MIQRIRIQNYRSLLDVTVELSPLTVLIGRSGTGKSNFVQAVRFLRNLLRTRNADVNANGGAPILNVDHPQEPIAFRVSFSVEGYEDAFEYGLSINLLKGHVEESLTVGRKVHFHHAQNKWLVKPDVATEVRPHGVILGSIPGLHESIFAYISLTSGIGCYDFPGFVLSAVGNNAPRSADFGLVDTGENYLLVSQKILADLTKATNWKRVSKSLKAINASVETLTLNAPNPDRLDVGHRFNGRLQPFDVRQESEGFRRYLATMLALYQNPPKQTMLFEHPEAGLHPGAMQALAEEFKDAPEEGRGQVVLTTHSPQFLDYFSPDSIRVVESHKGLTTIGPLSPEQHATIREHLLSPGELLTVDPARTASAP